MGFDQHLNYFKIAYTTALINNNPNIHLIFTNADHQFPTNKWILPGNGKS
jgi:ribonucleotide monophosphatase NagD (HAD superfamily)